MISVIEKAVSFEAVFCIRNMLTKMVKALNYGFDNKLLTELLIKLLYIWKV